jgi:hypothetical protein
MEETRRNGSEILTQTAFAIAIFTATAFFTGGCASESMTNPPRSATEELLLSTAADRALASVDLRLFAGKKVYVDASFFDSYDSKYVLGTIRDALSREGALLVDDSKSAEVIVEARSGGLSTDSDSSLFGVPALVIPIPFSGPMTIPELAFYKSQPQIAEAKFALLAYANQSREHVFSSGPLAGRAFNKYHKILFISWITTDIPEKQKNKQKAQPYQTWTPQEDLQNLPAAPVSAPSNH